MSIESAEPLFEEPLRILLDGRESCVYMTGLPSLLSRRIPKGVSSHPGWYFRTSQRPPLASLFGLLLTVLSVIISLIIVYLLLSRHFYLKKSSILSSPSENRFFYDRTLLKPTSKRGAQTHLRDILMGLPSSCESKEEVIKDEKPVVPIEDQAETSEKEETAPSDPSGGESPSSLAEEEEALNSTVIEVPKVENKTEDIPSFREWTQKALEKEEKERKEVQDKKKQQQQVLTDQQNSGNESLPSQPESSRNSSAEAPSPLPSSSPPSPASSGGSPAPSSALRLKKNYASIDCGAKIVGSNPESTGGNYIISSSRDEYMLNKCSDKTWFVIELCESIKARRIEIANFELYSSVPKEFRVSLSNVYPSSRRGDWTLFGSFSAAESRDVQAFDNTADSVFGKYVKVEVLSHHGSEHYCPISLFKIFGISEIELMAHDEEDEEEPPGAGPHEDDEEHAPKTRGGKSSLVNFIKEKVDETIGRVVKVVFRGGESGGDSGQSMDISGGQSLEQTPVYTLNCPHCNGTEFQEVASLMSSELSSLESLLKGQQVGLRGHLLNFACERFGFPSLSSSNSSTTTCAAGSPLYDFYACLFGPSRIIGLCNIVYYNEKVKTEAPSEAAGGEKDTIKGNSSSCAGAKGKSGDSSASGDEKKVAEESGPTAPLPPRGEEPSDPEIKPSRVEGSNGTETDSSSAGSSSDTPSAVVTPSTMPDPPSVVHVPPPASSMVNNPPAGQEPSSNTPANQRESVWQKLTNRIKSLERNVSFSSGYLEELSVQYKKQIEDLQLSVRQSAESLNLALKSILAEKNERKKLEAQIRELSSTLFILSEKVDSISSWTFGAHVTFIILEILVGCYCIVSTNKQIAGQLSGGYRAATTYSIESKEKETQQRGNSADDEQNMQIKKDKKPETPLLPPESSTPCSKRRHSLGEESAAPSPLGNKPRRSLDFSSFKVDSSEEHISHHQQQLTRRQRRRIQQNQRRKISASSKLKAPKIKVQNLFSCILPSIETNNMFGSLNSSVHGDPTPLKTPCYGENNNNNGEGVKVAQSLTAAKSFLRSKSTSPTRKSEAAKQREDFENFDPDEFRSTHSPLPPPN